MARGMTSSTGRNILTFIVAISIGLIFIVGFLAPQITEFFGTNTTGWDAGTVALWGVIIVSVIAGVVIVILKASGILAYVAWAGIFANAALIIAQKAPVIIGQIVSV